MRAHCPNCGFEGNVRDELIPEGGRTISCPKCKNTFLVRRGNGQPGRPISGSGHIGRPQPAATGTAAPPRSAPRAPSPFLIVIMAVLFLSLGFFGGYRYKGFVDGGTTAPTRAEKPEKGPKKPPGNAGPKRDRHPLMTPMGTPTAAIPPGEPGRAGGSKPETSFTAGTLFDTLSAMPPGQARNFCRKGVTAEVTGDGTIREIKKTSTGDGIIGIYSITVECDPDARVIITSKMTESYLSNFAVGSAVSFIGALADYAASGKQQTIYLADGMILAK